MQRLSKSISRAKLTDIFNNIYYCSCILRLSVCTCVTLSHYWYFVTLKCCFCSNRVSHFHCMRKHKNLHSQSIMKYRAYTFPTTWCLWYHPIFGYHLNFPLLVQIQLYVSLLTHYQLKYRISLWLWDRISHSKQLPVPGVLLIWIFVGQGPTALAVGAGGACLDIFSLVYHFSLLSPSLWETARYRLKHCLKGSLSPKQPTNQPTHSKQYKHLDPS